ncbi:hydantoinase/oxoprolinase family protein [Clostridium sp.]|uniref:hydantoinase/oxoprolinase family protein n=1 Tax=Clostridium sp. TaxID=1506 RepID=UPI001ED19A5C|nr:hydantoinase/oxoprolinase family protein [Clostridium sp.]MBS5886347.1 hydantoinase/oxoprolinase family protein [Clostridium sp.]MDU7241023.1 hydantoinase/oxoprolinase family protein [Clostridium sp.]
MGKVRIGIDVGGTFTDAVVIDNNSYEVIGKAKIPTTHHEKEGVAKGVIEVIKKVLEENNISPNDVVFIAHGTTQATNALLEGDVAKVGIIGMGKGIEGERAKNETKVNNIELSPGKYLYTEHRYIDSGNISQKSIGEAIRQLKDTGSEVIVASESYSVDNPENEKIVIEQSLNNGIYATGGYEISQLYGLRARTRTAVVNGALIPKMMETANMTETSVKNANIKKPLMIMRCDGGVMTIDEVRKRPILTMLSGLAAGVAGALMYEKVSDGIFFEVGGTSTDISVIKDGKVMIKNSQVGGHKLYLKSLDVRTLGVAGGSMIVVENNKIVDVGPRSAHIAEKEYEIFAGTNEISNPQLIYISPRPEDKCNYVAINCDEGKSFALTLAGAANILGYVNEDDYARGNIEEGRKAWEVLAKEVNMSIEETAKTVMDIAIGKVKKVVDELILEYKLNKAIIRLVGGGGSASIVTPYLSEVMGVKYNIAKNAPYISTIGVALALVREQIERSVINPTEQDIKKIRMDVFEAVVKSGANPDTVEITVDVDAKKNILRASATGATELRTKELGAEKKSTDELINVVCNSTGVSKENVKLIGETGRWSIFKCIETTKKLFGLISSKKEKIRILDEDGVIRLQKDKGKLLFCTKKELYKTYNNFIDENTLFTDAGAQLPKIYVIFKQKLIDLSGVISKEQLLTLTNLEIELLDEDTKIGILATQEI